MGLRITYNSRVIVLGAGASRSVSYSHNSDYPSPVDADFFDLLQRRSVRADGSADIKSAQLDIEAMNNVLARMKQLSPEYWHSMERAFYTLHLQAYMAEKLGHVGLDDSDERLLADFTRSIQALLRAAHQKERCSNHELLFSGLGPYGKVITFNYDLVAERALRKHYETNIPFGPWIYGMEPFNGNNAPLLLKLHGSSNWKIVPATPKHFEVRTKSWKNFDLAPGYRGHDGKGTTYPIFLPFWDKQIEKPPWLPLWKKAYEILSKATELIVWGYSLPITDVKAQHLFSLSLALKDSFKLCIIDPSPLARLRWRELFKNALYWEYNNIEEFFSHPPKWWGK